VRKLGKDVHFEFKEKENQVILNEEGSSSAEPFSTSTSLHWARTWSGAPHGAVAAANHLYERRRVRSSAGDRRRRTEVIMSTSSRGAYARPPLEDGFSNRAVLEEKEGHPDPRPREQTLGPITSGTLKDLRHKPRPADRERQDRGRRSLMKSYKARVIAIH